MTNEEMKEIERLTCESGISPSQTQVGWIITKYYNKKEDAVAVLKYIYKKNRKLFNKLDGYCTGHNRIEDKLMEGYNDKSWCSENREPDYYYISWR